MVMNLYRNMDREQIQFDFIVHNEAHQDYTDEVLALGGKIYHFPKFRGYNRGEMTRKWDAFFREHPEYKILHSHVRSYASLYLPIAKKHGVKTIIHSHSTSNGSGLSSVVKRILQSSLKKKADYLFACSEESGKWLFGKKAIRGENYRMIPNAVDTSKFSFNESVRSEMRTALEIDRETVVYGHVGRFHPAKNHMFLLEVFKGILAKQPNAVLVVVGDGALRGEIEEKINSLGISDSVKLLGSRGDVAELMQAMDVFLLPSIWEGLPVVLIEAQAAGLPCLVSDTVTKEANLTGLCTYLPNDQP
ncbi:MAG: glycosyltransferase, partial [Clostridia bacterium]|nr:glycosyltransferase [Clostridia bacterium]